MAPKKLLRPTASNRMNRGLAIGSSFENVEVTIETEEEEQREEVAMEVDSEIDEDSKKGPFPSGPERAILRCQQPVTLLGSWSLGDEANIFIEKVRESGLLPLAQYNFKMVN
ncbi:hypothetical protein QJS10_CPB21g01162 [Acorus calamus]|uniref:Uncharacterized protein n=1 Tax=Acorus calamus TaxID=4465 RepID=A0AAV9C7Z0_ACOCL|nr:hypothetical protein QJS10_CPB21g01162 [Acorus calamus]